MSNSKISKRFIVQFEVFHQCHIKYDLNGICFMQQNITRKYVFLNNPKREFACYGNMLYIILSHTAEYFLEAKRKVI